MSMKVGIHENLVLAKSIKNDRGTLVVGVRKEEDIDPIAASNASGDMALEQEEQDFFIYPIKNVDHKKQLLDYTGVMKEIGNVKDPLDHILRQFLTSGNIKWDIYKGTIITGANIKTEVLKQSNLDIIYKNIVDQYTEMITPYLNNSAKKLRGVFPRTSAAKPYPTLRRRYLDSQPIFEPMTVPVEASKVRFSKYEIEKKLNVADAIQATAPVSEEVAAAADALFNQE